MPVSFNDYGAQYSQVYIDECRMLWYKAGRPTPKRLYDLIPKDSLSGKKPEPTTLSVWINQKWKEWADEMDMMVEDQIKSKLIEEKVSMFERFTKVGQQMQNIALDWLEGHKDNLNAIAVVRLLVDGVRIEQEARGVPQVLRKMIKMTDDELMDEVKQLISRSPMTIETIQEISGDVKDDAEIQE